MTQPSMFAQGQTLGMVARSQGPRLPRVKPWICSSSHGKKKTLQTPKPTNQPQETSERGCLSQVARLNFKKTPCGSCLKSMFEHIWFFLAGFTKHILESTMELGSSYTTQNPWPFRKHRTSSKKTWWSANKALRKAPRLLVKHHLPFEDLFSKRIYCNSQWSRKVLQHLHRFREAAIALSYPPKLLIQQTAFLRRVTLKHSCPASAIFRAHRCGESFNLSPKRYTTHQD